ncbi:ATP-binding cassette domain-containing protein [Borreliella yangtzensis]|uniref:ABC-2 type transport system ATP-binding protein n=1 Tax=Borreliella yangtzensis TaxID=683292 RepID=A0ABR6P8F7_9SPIR|nr:ABC transporter ATP-binding protein [Borreliella yangtzensis]MBB6042560.1 ABC-2 type transport system ATP-binding protein [Borreliella yangtzensis]WKC73529.1 ABC transporter ATP-binding protein [Borreliella yangtzensis]WKC74445.1 ABC transporter ATP-binding protein [Borreliella yangtzensis]
MAIEVINVKFSYKEKEVYSNLNLNIEIPQTYLLLGKNGVGKTTLLKLVSGLLEPLKGKVLFNSLAVFPRDPLNLVNLFFIPEEFSLPRLSLAEYSKALSRFYPNFNKADFEKYLLEFNLDISLELSSASFGQKKKSIIAFSLATNVSCLLFDEPTNSLDIVSKNVFRNVLSNLNDRVIFITGHNVRDLTGVVDYLIIVGEKSILFSNSVSYINKNYKIKIVSELNGNELYYEKNKEGFKALYFEISNGDEVIDIEFFFLYVTENKK